MLRLGKQEGEQTITDKDKGVDRVGIETRE
jgi:hypothetical protein